MDDLPLEQLCELGQEQLMQTRYLDAEATLVKAERIALDDFNWDVLSRLYMPLQEARRQRRQKCGEGIVCLDLLAEGPADHLEARHVVEHYPHGQLLVAGWGAIEPAIRVRQMAADHELYLEIFLGATYPVDGVKVVIIVSHAHLNLPKPEPRTFADLVDQLPANCLVFRQEELPAGPRPGTYQTFGQVMQIWERLHAPFLAAADAEPDLRKRIEAYQKTIQVDYACELAHQRLSAVASSLARYSGTGSR